MLPIAVPCTFGVSAQQIYIANLLTIFAVQKLALLGIEGFQEMPIALLAFCDGTAIGFTAFRRIKNG